MGKILRLVLAALIPFIILPLVCWELLHGTMTMNRLETSHKRYTAFGNPHGTKKDLQKKRQSMHKWRHYSPAPLLFCTASKKLCISMVCNALVSSISKILADGASVC